MNLKTEVTRKQSKFSEKRTFLTPDMHYVCVSGGEKYLFFGKFGVVSRKMFSYYLRFEIRPFTLSPASSLLKKGVKLSFRGFDQSFEK